MNTAELIQEQREIWQYVLSIHHQRTEAEGELDALWQKVQQALAEAQEFLRREDAEALWEQARPAPITSSPDVDAYRAFTQAVQDAMQAVANLLGLLQQPRVWKATRSWEAHGGGGSLLGLGKTMHLAFSPQGALLASGGADKRVKIWDIAAGRLLHTLSGHYWRRQRGAAGQIQRTDPALLG